MKRLFLGFALSTFLIGSATAQGLPSPFGQAPDFPHPGTPEAMRKCSPEYDRELADQLAQLESLRGVTAEQIMNVCDGVGTFEQRLKGLAEALGEDSEAFAQQLDAQIRDFGKSVGIPNLDLRYVKKICVQQAGEVDRTIITEIGRLRSEQQRCAGI